ncbi:sulfotransferase [Haliea sp. E17]|uniref:sulfotransferase n=1 Tax=Haliea sp. E17 TaxID=3401576 RepID=UPI003AAC14D7
MKKFIILTMPRSGSTYIRLWLNNHPEVRCHGEVFLRTYPALDGYRHFTESHKKRYFLTKCFGNPAMSRVSYNLPLARLTQEYLTSLFSNPEHSAPFTEFGKGRIYNPQVSHDSEKAVGFKLMYQQLLDFRCLFKWINSDDIKIILLTRDNLLEMYISNLMMVKRGIAHTSSKQLVDKIHISPKKACRAMAKMEHNASKMRDQFESEKVLEITYEEFFKQHESCASRIWSFLGVDAQNVTSPSLKKISSHRVDEKVKNYKELADALSGTPYERFLDEPVAQ